MSAKKAIYGRWLWLSLQEVVGGINSTAYLAAYKKLKIYFLHI